MENKEAEKIFKTYINDIYRYSYFKLGNKEEAEDASSETFMRILKDEKILNIKDSKAWIIGVARNVIYEKYREKTKHSANGEEHIDIVADSSVSIEETAINESQLELIKQKLNILDDLTKEVITLKTWENLNFKEIAEVLDEKEEMVKAKYYRGIEKLKELVERDDRSKVKVFALPTILFAISQLPKGLEFQPAGTFVTGLLKTNLTLINTIMSNSILAGNAAIGAAATVAGTVSGIGAKVLAVAVSAIVVGGVGAAALVNLNNQPLPNNTVGQPTSYVDSNKIIIPPQPETKKMATFESTRYNVKFSYPKEFGDITVNFSPNYFNNEGVSFANSRISLGWWRIEGAFGGNPANDEIISTKDGKTCTLRELTQGVNQELTAVYFECQDPNHLGATIHGMVQMLSDPNEIETIKQQYREIAKTLEFDLRAPKTTTFSSSRYNVTFDYPSRMGDVSVSFNQNYFSNELVNFSSSKLGLQWRRFEGGFGPAINSENLTAKDGKPCVLNEYEQGVNHDLVGIFLMCEDTNHIGTSVFGSVQGLSDRNEIEKLKADYRFIVSTLQFDLLDLNSNP